MNAFGALFTLLTSVLLFGLPRRYAVMPLLLGATYMTAGQVLELGPAHFTVTRILVTVGVLRVLMRKEGLAGGMHPLDWWMIAWAALLVGSSAFHIDGMFVYRAGVAWTELGYYMLFRVFIVNSDDIRRLFGFICVSLLPIAALMMVEKITGENQFAFLGGVNDFASNRNGQLRASGPFVHAILAGSVGATCFGMAMYLRGQKARYGYVGIVSALGILYASSSSGPMMMAAFILLGMWSWPVRQYMRVLRWLSVAGVFALDRVMNDPFYYILARIDVAGGSQGWFRAELIHSSIEHLNEWWFAGTDHTRHWMPSGIYADPNHTDITNHILMMGVEGGLPLMITFVILLWAAFRTVGKTLDAQVNEPKSEQFLTWTLGALLFGHVTNFFGITLFDQSVVFFYLVLAAIAACAVQSAVHAPKPQVGPTLGIVPGQRRAGTWT